MTWQETLSELVMMSSLHGRFLNTISLMEYIGARKIVKSQREADIKPEILAHMAEEIRHAQMFKKMAVKLNPRLTTYDEHNLVAGAQGRAYMQNIDRGVESLLGSGRPWQNYLLSTLIIEERANQVYPVYADLLKPLGMDGPLRTIIREEENHLADIKESLLESSPLNQEQLAALQEIEEQAFMAIIGEVQNAVHQEKSQGAVVFHH